MVSPRLLLSASLCVFAVACHRQQQAQPTPPPPAVTAITLQGESVSLTRELPGRASAFLVAEVRPQVTGIVQKRLFTEGGMVEEGQPLYQLDDSTYRADYDRAKATLARAQSSLEIARLKAQRNATLAKENAVSREENENATAALAQAEADLQSAQAALSSAETVLGYTTIRSPIKGRIGRSSVTQGALVTANQATPLATVQQLDPVYVDVTQSSREMLELRKDIEAGTVKRPDEVPVSIVLEDGSRYPHDGKLQFAEATVDPTTGSFALRVVVPNPEGLLLPGAYVQAIVTTGIRENAILAPQQGISRDPRGNATAMVVGADGKAEARVVRVSRTIGDKWLVDSGLSAGDKLIVEGLQKVKPGSPVRITATTLAPPTSTAAGGAQASNK